MLTSALSALLIPTGGLACSYKILVDKLLWHNVVGYVVLTSHNSVWFRVHWDFTSCLLHIILVPFLCTSLLQLLQLLQRIWCYLCDLTGMIWVVVENIIDVVNLSYIRSVPLSLPFPSLVVASMLKFGSIHRIKEKFASCGVLSTSLSEVNSKHALLVAVTRRKRISEWASPGKGIAWGYVCAPRHQVSIKDESTFPTAGRNTRHIPLAINKLAAYYMLIISEMSSLSFLPASVEEHTLADADTIEGIRIGCFLTLQQSKVTELFKRATTAALRNILELGSTNFRSRPDADHFLKVCTWLRKISS